MSTTTEFANNATSPDTVERYAELINRYGALIVIAAVFLVIILAVMVIMLKSYQKTQNLIQTQNQTMFEAILDNLASSKEEKTKDKEEHKELVDIFIKMSIPIRSTLEVLADKLNADRTSVYVFHNGTNTSHGLPFIKISCLTEVMKRGTLVARKVLQHQGLPLSTFDKSISYLVSSQVGYILNNEEDDRFPAIKNMLTSAGVLSAGFLALYDDDNNMLGIIITEFATTKTEEEMESIIDVMKEESLKIIPVLDYADYQEKKNEE